MKILASMIAVSALLFSAPADAIVLDYEYPAIADSFEDDVRLCGAAMPTDVRERGFYEPHQLLTDSRRGRERGGREQARSDPGLDLEPRKSLRQSLGDGAS